MPTAEIDLNINILLQTRGLETKGFGIPLIEGTSFPFFRVKTDAAASTKEILWISKIRNTVFQQIKLTDPSAPDTALAVGVTGSGTSGDPHIIDVTLSTDSGSVITATASAVAAIVNADGTAGPLLNGTATGSGTGIVTPVAATPLVTVSATRDNTFTSSAEMITLGYELTDKEVLIADALLGQDLKPPTFVVHSRDGDDTTDDSITESLTTLRTTNDTWYFILIEETTKAALQEAGDFAASNEKLFVGNTADLTALTGRNNIREAYVIDDKAATEFPAAAWVGRVGPTTPGSVTWKWKQLNNVTAGDFTTTQLTTIRNDDGQAIVDSRGRIYMNEGITTGKEFIDIIRGRDFLNSRLLEELILLFTNNDKVGFDNQGIGQIEGVVRGVLNEVSANDYVAGVSDAADAKNSDDGAFQFQVSTPAFSSISSTDKSNRNLPNVKFTLVPKGAIHTLTINGTIGFAA